MPEEKPLAAERGDEASGGSVKASSRNMNGLSRRV
jgi:hypothetical protein